MTHPLLDLLKQGLGTFDEVLQGHQADLVAREVGTVTAIGHGVARVSGLPGVGAEELVLFEGNRLGLAFDLTPAEVGIVLLDSGKEIRAGSLVRRTGRILDVPVGEELLGRVVNPLGMPLDEGAPPRSSGRLPVEREAPPILHRAPVSQPLQTGIKVIDALLPIGRGQRELILGDRQTGKTALAIDAVLNQRADDVLCIYCAVGQRSSAVAKLLAVLRGRGALGSCIVVVAAGDDSPGLQFIAPFAATTMAEWFVERGRDVLIIYDDLTRHARAYRELSLLLRRPPGREAYPGDIFYLHSRLLERSARLRPDFGGGSLTALPIVETQAQNLSAFIPTNLISITDGQLYLSPDLFRKGVLPAVEVGKSVSRVGGKAQIPAFRAVAGDLRLSYAQFEELEVFARFGTRLDEATQRTLDRGRRIREVLKQPQYEPRSAAEQILVLLAAGAGLLDAVPIERIPEAEDALRHACIQAREVFQRLERGEKLAPEDRALLTGIAKEAVAFAST